MRKSFSFEEESDMLGDCVKAETPGPRYIGFGAASGVLVFDLLRFRDGPRNRHPKWRPPLSP
jgi:hypothetical protein